MCIRDRYYWLYLQSTTASTCGTRSTEPDILELPGVATAQNPEILRVRKWPQHRTSKYCEYSQYLQCTWRPNTAIDSARSTRSILSRKYCCTLCTPRYWSICGIPGMLHFTALSCRRSAGTCFMYVTYTKHKSNYLVLRVNFTCWYLYKKLKNVSCEYDRLNGSDSTLQAAWYIRHVRWTCLFYTSKYFISINSTSVSYTHLTLPTICSV